MPGRAGDGAVGGVARLAELVVEDLPLTARDEDVTDVRDVDVGCVGLGELGELGDDGVAPLVEERCHALARVAGCARRRQCPDRVQRRVAAQLLRPQRRGRHEEVDEGGDGVEPSPQPVVRAPLGQQEGREVGELVAGELEVDVDAALLRRKRAVRVPPLPRRLRGLQQRAEAGREGEAVGGRQPMELDLRLTRRARDELGVAEQLQVLQGRGADGLVSRQAAVDQAAGMEDIRCFDRCRAQSLGDLDQCGAEHRGAHVVDGRELAGNATPDDTRDDVVDRRQDLRGGTR